MGFEWFHAADQTYGAQRALLRQSRKLVEQSCRTIARLRKPLPDELVVHPHRTLWRLYWIWRGALCPPFYGLTPVPKIETAACRGYPEVISPLRGCLPEEIPHPACHCGLRAGDRLEALYPVLRQMVIHPDLFGAIGRTMTAENVSRDGFDYPTPAVVRVAAEDVALFEGEARVIRWLTGTEQGRSFAQFAMRDPARSMPDGFGLYRARQLDIVGPVIRVPVRYAEPDMRDLAEQYGVDIVNAPSADSADLERIMSEHAS